MVTFENVSIEDIDKIKSLYEEICGAKTRMVYFGSSFGRHKKSRS